MSPQQVVLAWELSLGKRVIPIPGASRPESIVDSALAADLVLTTGGIGRLLGRGSRARLTLDRRGPSTADMQTGPIARPIRPRHSGHPHRCCCMFAAAAAA